jgi:hypothetical protein
VLYWLQVGKQQLKIGQQQQHFMMAITHELKHPLQRLPS